MSISQAQMLADVETKAQSILEYRLYWTLRNLNVKTIHPEHIRLMKYVMAYNSLGYTLSGKVTIEMLTSVMKKYYQNIKAATNSITQSCHVLGDKGILEISWIGRKLAYSLSSYFFSSFKRYSTKKVKPSGKI